MTDPLRFPVRNRDDPFDLAEFGELAREKLDGDERRLVRQIGLGLVMQHGRIETFGDALDLIAAAGPAGRRQMVDQARVEMGLPTIADEQAAARFEAANRAIRPNWGITQCAFPGCGVSPTNPNGSLREVECKRWWCPTHADNAEPGDFDPPEPRYVLNRNLALKPVGEEKERLEAEARKRREEWEKQQEAKRRDGERLQRIEDAHRAQLKPPAVYRVDPQ